MSVRKLLSAAAALALLVAVRAPDAAAQTDVEKFYTGKKIDFIVGSAPGGGYAIYGAILGRHIGKHIPGHPSVIERDLDGAGSLVAANEIYNKSPKDGSVFGAVFMGALVEPLIGNPNQARYDARKFGMIGSANREASICFSWGNVPAKDWSYMYDNQMMVAGAGATSSIKQYPQVLAKVLGMKFKIISGYPGSRESVSAVEKGEVQGVCGIQWSSFIGPYHDWMDQKKINIFGQIAGLDGDPELNKLGFPNLYDFVKNDDDRGTLALIFGQMEFGRPYITPPGIPPERLEALRKAFDETMTDPDYLADAAKAQLLINPMGGAEMQQVVDKLYDTPQRLVDRAKEALK